MSGTSTPAREGGLTTWVIVLLGLTIFVNYVDRGSLSVAAPGLERELGIGDRQLGLLLSAFFWVYAPMQPLAGWLCERFDVRRLIIGSLVLWSAATMACGLIVGFTGLFLLRLLVGLGESVVFPAAACLIARHAPQAIRGRANSATTIGLSFGPSAGTLIGGLVLAVADWRAVFFVLGGLSLLVALPWLGVRIGGPARSTASDPAAAPASPGPGFETLLGSRSLWAMSTGQFALNYGYYLLLAWLPTFLVRAQHQSASTMAVTGMGLYAMGAVGGFVSGQLSDRLVAAGRDVTRVRKGLLLIGLGASGVGAALAGLSTGSLALAAVALAIFAQGIAHPQNFGIGQIMAGPTAAGRWMGIQNFGGNLAGIVAPALTGAISAATGSFTGAFFVSAGLAVVGAACYLLAGPVREIDWTARIPAPQPALAR